MRFLFNIDKHRVLVVTIVAAHQMTIAAPYPDQFTDCRHESRIYNGQMATMVSEDVGRPIEPGDVVLRMFVEALGDNPDVELEPEFTGVVGVRTNWRPLDTLDVIGEQTTAILRGVRASL